MTDQEHAEHIDFLCRTFGAEHVAYALGETVECLQFRHQLNEAIEARAHRPSQPVQVDMFAEATP